MKKFRKIAAMSLAMVMVASVFMSGCAKKQDNAGAPTGDATKNAETKKEEVKYPTKAIQVIVPAGAGGDTDLNARTMSKYLEKELGQPIVIVNVNGAGGSLGSKKVKDSAPDGYSVLFFHPGLLLNKMLGLVDYTYTDFENGGVALLDDTNVFVVNAESPYKTIKDVIEDAKKNPSKIKFATETGSFTQLQVIAFENSAGIKLNVVDVGAAAQKTAALLGKQIEIIGTQYGLVKDHITSGKFRAIGVLSKERNPLIPDVPTFKEQGVDISFTKFFAYWFPKGTPTEIVEKFSKAVENVSKNEEYKADAKKFLVTPTYMSPADSVKYLKETEDFYNKYKDIITNSTVAK